jgi:hypothetical protein
MEKQSRRRIRTLENLLAAYGLFESESGCVRISIVANNTKAHEPDTEVQDQSIHRSHRACQLGSRK